MVKLTILLSFLSLALATAAKPQLFTSSEPVESHFDKSAPEPVKRYTNAERLADGLGPAMPRALGNLLPMRSRRERRVKNYRRQAPTTSATPPTCDNRPFSTAPVAQYVGYSDDSSFTINLPFQVQIYGTLTNTLAVSSNGWIQTSNTNANALGGVSLPTNAELPGAGIFAYWDDLVVPGNSQDNVFVEATANALIIRWKVFLYRNRSVPVDFTLTYSTTRPGVWMVFYDVVPPVSDSATVGAQSSVDVSPRASILYTYDTAGTTYNGLCLSIITRADGTSSIGNGGTAP